MKNARAAMEGAPQPGENQKMVQTSTSGVGALMRGTGAVGGEATINWHQTLAHCGIWEKGLKV